MKLRRDMRVCVCACVFMWVDKLLFIYGIISIHFQQCVVLIFLAVFINTYLIRYHRIKAAFTMHCRHFLCHSYSWFEMALCARLVHYIKTSFTVLIKFPHKRTIKIWMRDTCNCHQSIIILQWQVSTWLECVSYK